MKYLPLFAAIVILYGCMSTNIEKQNSYKSWGKYKVKPFSCNLKFELDNTTSMQWTNIFMFKDTAARYITTYNRNKNQIQFYNIEKQLLEFNIQIHSEGENAIPQFYGFWVKNLDSIYITPGWTKELILINREGVILDKYDYSACTNGDINYPYYSSSYEGLQPIFTDSLTYFPQRITGDSEKKFNKDSISSEKLAFSLNFFKREVISLPLKYPQFPKEYDGVFYRFSFAYGYPNFVFAFKYLNEAIVTTNFIDERKIFLKSRFIEELSATNLMSDGQLRNSLSKGEYDNLLYDPYRKVYYRFVFLPINNISASDNLDQLFDYRPEISVLIINKDFEVIGETLLPKNTYYTKMSFVLEEGLFISTNHINNPNLNEDIVEFQCFELVKNEE